MPGVKLCRRPFRLDVDLVAANRVRLYQPVVIAPRQELLQGVSGHVNGGGVVSVFRDVLTPYTPETMPATIQSYL